MGTTKKVAAEKYSLLRWKVNTCGLLEEIVACGMDKKNGVLFIPINKFKEKLTELTERCAEINDPILNLICWEMALYEGSLPSNKGYTATTKALIKKANEQIKKEKSCQKK